jgi:hypothetical protein
VPFLFLLAAASLPPDSVALVNADPNPSALLQFYRNGDLSLRSPSLFIARNLLLLLAAWWQTREQTAVAAAAAAATRNTQRAETVLDGPHIEFELYGNQFCFHAADRAGRELKHKEAMEL